MVATFYGQVFRENFLTVDKYRGGARISSRPLVDPFQSEEPFSSFSNSPVQGAWTLQLITDPDVGVGESSGTAGTVSDWVLLITDWANVARVVYLDVTAQVLSLPKYGTLFPDAASPITTVGTSLLSASRSSQALLKGAGFRVEGACNGVADINKPYRTCYTNFGVGAARAPAHTSDRAAFNLFPDEHAVHYVPRTNFLGRDEFTYRVWVRGW